MNKCVTDCTVLLAYFLEILIYKAKYEEVKAARTDSQNWKRFLVKSPMLHKKSR